ncbi:MAG TPA: penicillin-binding transpeptidase domain-containing protein [Candidatus Avamphibacillus sp.]|nr:penicillin-binding transpeptidase domain-containing protein [Candidatus Avamphibacillus sp.]
MKKSILVVSMIIFAFLTACSSDEVTPNEQFNTYVKQWNNKEFGKMYEIISSDAKKEYSTEEFVDRYKKIYKDLAISNLNVTFEKLPDEDIKKAMKEGKASIPFQVEMDSIAGPISFQYNATLVKEENNEEEETWFVKWDTGFIFPELKDGGKIGIETTPPARGEILDRNKMPLALNDTVREIGVVPEELGNNPEESKQQIANLLNMTVEEIDEKLNANWVEPNLFVPLKTVLPTDTNLLDQLGEIDGVMGNEVTGRYYPLGETAAHLVGYVGQITAEELKENDSDTYSPNDMIGKRGLEQLFEDQLRGEPGAKIFIKKENEEDIIIAEKEVKNGENIQLTIDVNIQEKIYNTYNGDAGTAAAIHPKTGETLALVSSPAFDPNELLYSTNENKWSKLEDDPQTPLINRFSATYAPGSVIKPITAAIGLNNGTIDPNEGIEINGLTWSNGKGWGNYKVRRVSTGNGPVDLADALIRSDNIYFAMKAVEMGSDAYIDGLKEFGLGEDFPYKYPISPSTISTEGTIENEVLLANTSYGQGEIQFSPLHMALSYTPFLNEGNLLKPTLLLDEKKGQVWRKNIISAEEAILMQDILRDVVTEGTAKKAKKADFPISGKTGTAELKLSGESGKENGWFVGYPTDDQDILIAMMIENTESKGGSSYTVEKVTDALLQIKN